MKVKELILTQQERYILLNLIEHEFKNILNLNSNIYFKLKGYEAELKKKYTKKL